FEVSTKKGSNEFHGSIFGEVTPGIFEGPREPIVTEGSTITDDITLSSIRSFGMDLGGPIIKDKLWFYVGFSPSFTTYKLERNINRFQLDAAGNPVLDENGHTITSRVDGTQKFYNAEERTFQWIGKLTYAFSPDHSLTLSVFGSPTSSGGNGTFGFNN